MTGHQDLITRAKDLATTVGIAIVQGDLTQAVRDTLEARVHAVTEAAGNLKTAVDHHEALHAVEAAAELTQAIAALSAEATVAGIAVQATRQ
jgi:phosphopantetheine adenylyltransferase